jgi:hypothetical protein
LASSFFLDETGRIRRWLMVHPYIMRVFGSFGRRRGIRRDGRGVEEYVVAVGCWIV